jgi:hypothetical protein
MKDFFQAFGGLIGVGLIVIVALAAMIFADFLISRLQHKRGNGSDEEASK